MLVYDFTSAVTVSRIFTAQGVNTGGNFGTVKIYYYDGSQFVEVYNQTPTGLPDADGAEGNIDFYPATSQYFNLHFFHLLQIQVTRFV